VHDHDFDFEDSPGIPAPLPPGEHVVWQGSPHWRIVARQVFHVRKVAVYFTLILAFQIFSIYHNGSDATAASLSLTVLLSLSGLGILTLLAYLTGRVSIYTVTNRRILIRFGIALQMTMNLPFSQIKAADMRIGKHGYGDIHLTVNTDKRVSYLVLWPHIRPWNFSRPQPMLRAIGNVKHVAAIIADVASQLPVDNYDEISTRSKTGKQNILVPTEIS